MAAQKIGALGWDEASRLELSKALKQPLMVQTPLQVILEALFTRIQSQAQAFTALEKRLERVEAQDMNNAELMGRIRLCEEALSSVTHGKLSPFDQQDLLQRIEEVEAQVAELPATLAAATQAAQGNEAALAQVMSESLMARCASRRVSTRNADPGRGNTGGGAAPVDPALETRIESLEQKLAGVYNLNGVIMAVEHMASEMGVEIHDTEYTTASLGESGATGTAPVVPRRNGLAVLSSPQPAETETPVGNSPDGSRLGSPAVDSEGGVWPVSARGLKLGGGGGKRIAEVCAQVDTLQVECDQLRQLVGKLQQDMGSVSEHADAGEDALSLRVAVLEASSVEMRENLMAEVAAVRKEQKREVEVSFADFSVLAQRVESATASLSTITDGLNDLKDQQVQPLKDQVAQLVEQGKRANEARDMDSLFHTRINKLETAVGDIKGEVQSAVQDLLQDVARIPDLEQLEEAINRSAAASDVRQLAAQQASLAQSVSGLADWLAARPETAEGARAVAGTPSATRFKCLTCDREIRTPMIHTEAKSKGTLLPKLEGMPSSHAGSPVGPGLNAGELRRLAEERASGLKGSPPGAADLDDYAGGGEPARHKSPQSRGRSGGRTILAMPASNLMSKPSGGPRTPVFI